MGSTITQTGNAYGINGGTIKGKNLFHSFGLFNVPTGGSATFTGPNSNGNGPSSNNNGPSSIDNIVSRVTGGQLSTIDGLIDSKTSMPNANFYLINPSGVVFGSGARLEVGGAFHVSTADYLRFADGEKFFANLSNESVLSVAQPAAYGFLSPTPAPISVQGSRLRVDPGKTLSLVGGDVQIAGSVPVATTLGASGGQVQIVSVGPPVSGRDGVVTLNPDVNVGSFTRLGQIDVSKGARIDASGVRGGTVSIRGGRLIVDNSSLLANTTGSLAGAQLGIDLKVEGDIVLRNLTSVQTRASGAGRAGNIEVEARNGSVSVTGGARIGSESLLTGPAGNVTVKATDAVVLAGAPSSIFSFSFLRTVSAGEILVEGRSVTVMGRAQIESGRVGTQGGNVAVIAKDSIVIAGGGNITSRAFSRNVGFIEISVPDGTLMMDNGFINAITRNIGNAGRISVNARDVTLARGSRINSSSELSATTGAGGNLTVTADSVTISGGSGLFSNTEGRGRGGNIIMRARQVELIDGTISAKSSGTAAAIAGDISINAGAFRSRNSVVTTDSSQADGGNIELTARSLVHLRDSEITTSVRSGRGAGGNISIDPEFVVLDHSRVRADAFGGPGGNIGIRTGVFLNSHSLISASSAQDVPGTIDVQAGVTDLSGSLAQLPEAVLQAAALLRASCATRLAGGQASSLVVAGREGLPAEPGSSLFSPLIAEGPLEVSEQLDHRETLPSIAMWAVDPHCSR